MNDASPESTASNPQKRRRAIPPWERAAIRKLIWVGLAAAFAGEIVGVILERIFGTRSGAVFSLPWIVVFIMIIPAAYQRGVRDGRSHPEDTAVDNSKT
jgi:hypothetical protein